MDNNANYKAEPITAKAKRRLTERSSAPLKKKKEKGFWNQAGHLALDVAGLVPVVGEAADLANAGWYAAEGDYKNAGLSALAAVPFAGWGATATKLGMKGYSKLSKTAKAIDKVSSAGVGFGKKGKKVTVGNVTGLNQPLKYPKIERAANQAINLATSSGGKSKASNGGSTTKPNKKKTKTPTTDTTKKPVSTSNKPLKTNKKGKSYDQAYKDRDKKVYGKMDKSSYIKEAKRQNTVYKKTGKWDVEKNKKRMAKIGNSIYSQSANAIDPS